MLSPNSAVHEERGTLHRHTVIVRQDGFSRLRLLAKRKLLEGKWVQALVQPIEIELEPKMFVHKRILSA